MANELIVVEQKNVLTLFTKDNELDSILKQVEMEVATFEHDLSNEARRKKTASLARKVASTKTYLDGLGKDLVAKWKASAKVVDQNRKQMRDRLDELKELARKPLTEWENEQSRIEQEQKEAAEKEALRIQIESDHEIGLLMNERHDRDVADKIAAELEIERQRVEQEKKDRTIREAKIAQDAKEKAEREALARENQLKIDALAAEEREKKAEAEKIAAQELAMAQAKQYEIDRVEDAKRQAQIAKDTEQKRLADIENAKQQEIQRQEMEKKQAELDRQKNEANKKHAAKIHNEMMQAAINSGVDAAQAKAFVVLLAKGAIPHVGKIQY